MLMGCRLEGERAVRVTADAGETTLQEKVGTQSLRGTACFDSGVSSWQNKAKNCANWQMDVQEDTKR